MMDSNDVIRRAVRYTLYANAAAAVAGMSSAAMAQDQPASPEAAPLQEVVVTGSRIAQPGLEGISPVTAVDAQELKYQGTTRIEDLLNNLPQVNPGQGSNISNGATGTATVDLRGLGPQRTLVLVNGRRLMPGEPTNNGTGEADLNQIPAALVERIDVLTGGASSVYGADAVAGVVNFVMNDHFQGFKVEANAGGYEHHQHNFYGQFAPAAGFGSPPSTVFDGNSKDLTFVLGGNFADNKGNVTAYIGWRRNGDIAQGRRDFSRCTLTDAPGCGGSSTSFPGAFYTDGLGKVTLGPNQTFVKYTGANAYNYGALNFYQRPDERWDGGAFAHYDINDNVQMYSEFMSMQDRSIGQVAPSGAFLAAGLGATNGVPNGQFTLNCDNPLLSAEERTAICGAQTTGTKDLLLGRRNVEGGPRQDDLSHTSFRALIGSRGSFGEMFTYDIYAQEGRTQLSENFLNDVSKSRLSQSLLAVNDPLTGTITCAANANGANGAPGCVPYNIWGSPLAAGPAAAVAYFSTPGFQQGISEERIYSGNITADLGKVGIKLPTASSGLVVNVGAEYREESVDFRSDEEYITNDLAGQGNPTLPLKAQFGVKEGFMEARMPLVQDMPFAKEISFETGYRYSKYDLGFSTNTYKFGVDWAPTSDLRMRGSYQRAVRAPSLSELFRQKFVANDFGVDPCASSSGSPAAASAAQCLRSGVSAAQYGTIGVPGNPAGQYQGLVGGSAQLKPEVSDTYSVGLVLTPSMLPDFNMTIDYYDIKIKNVINSLGAQFTLNQCVYSGNANYCPLINRGDSFASLWLSPVSYVEDLTQNLGAYHTRGVDIASNYRLDMSALGKLIFQFTGTYVADFLVTPSTIPAFNVGTFNCAGYYGNTCGAYNNTPNPKWRHRLRTTYQTPIQGLDASIQWRHINKVKEDTTSPNPLLTAATKPLEASLGTRDYFDVSMGYEVLKGISVRLGVNNVLDKDPPVVAGGDFSSANVNGNTYPQLYDTLGRFMFVNITAEF